MWSTTLKLVKKNFATWQSIQTFSLLYYVPKIHFIEHNKIFEGYYSWTDVKVVLF